MLYGMIFVHSFLAAARIKWARYNIRLWRYYVIASLCPLRGMRTI